jgi:hypothetical protein
VVKRITSTSQVINDKIASSILAEGNFGLGFQTYRALWRSGYRARLEILFLRERRFESCQRRFFFCYREVWGRRWWWWWWRTGRVVWAAWKGCQVILQAGGDVVTSVCSVTGCTRLLFAHVFFAVCCDGVCGRGMSSAGDCVPRLLDVISITCHERSHDDIAVDLLAANTFFRLRYDFVQSLGLSLWTLSSGYRFCSGLESQWDGLRVAGQRLESENGVRA